MTSRHFLVVVALFQGVLLASFIVLVVLNRWFRVRRRLQVHPRRVALDQAMQGWAAGTADLEDVLTRLRRVPTPVAIDALVSWTARVSGERWQALAAAVERQGWARLVRANFRSWRWWKRLECARLLSVVARPTDTRRVLRLLADPHPAVHIAAVATLERVESPALIAAALEGLRRSPPTVQAYYAGMLRRARPLVIQQLLGHLSRTHRPGLVGLAEFAVRLRDPALREPLTGLATHADAEVRAQSARALGHFPHGHSISALRGLANDPEWPVRAQAARSLGMIADPTTLPTLVGLLRDVAWWVRLRAGLALTRFGPAGRKILVDAAGEQATAARAVADLVLGLSPPAIAEYSA